MIKTITFSGKEYPEIQAEGFAAQYAFPFARKYCIGTGFDIGCMKPQWILPGALPIDPAMNKFDAMNLPSLMSELFFEYAEKIDSYIQKVDYIFSSHCLEHLPDYVDALDYWSTRLRSDGVLFLYLPNMDYQHYWRPQNNRKHLHYINPAIMRSYFEDRKEMWRLLMVTEGYDVNGSFYAIAEKI